MIRDGFILLGFAIFGLVVTDHLDGTVVALVCAVAGVGMLAMGLREEHHADGK